MVLTKLLRNWRERTAGTCCALRIQHGPQSWLRRRGTGAAHEQGWYGSVRARVEGTGTLHTPEVRQQDAEKLEAEVFALVRGRVEEVALDDRLPQRLQLSRARHARRPGLVRVCARILRHRQAANSGSSEQGNDHEGLCCWPP